MWIFICAGVSNPNLLPPTPYCSRSTVSIASVWNSEEFHAIDWGKSAFNIKWLLFSASLLVLGHHSTRGLHCSETHQSLLPSEWALSHCLSLWPPTQPSDRLHPHGLSFCYLFCVSQLQSNTRSMKKTQERPKERNRACFQMLLLLGITRLETGGTQERQPAPSSQRA